VVSDVLRGDTCSNSSIKGAWRLTTCVPPSGLEASFAWRLRSSARRRCKGI